MNKVKRPKDLRQFRTYIQLARHFHLSEEKLTHLIDLLNDAQFDDSWMSETARKLLELFGYTEEHAQEFSDIYGYEEIKVLEREKVEAN